QRLELLAVPYRSIFGDVEDAVGVELGSQHVINSNVRNHGSEQVRTLRQCRSHQQSAVASSHDRQAGRIGVLGLDQIFRAGDEVIENILLAREIAGLVPLLAVLSAS